jgi:hypothetical protein
MRTQLLSMLLISMMMGTYISKAANPEFYIASKAICDDNLKSTVGSELVNFQKTLAIEIGKAFPCTKVVTQHDFYQGLDNFRKREILGEDNDKELSKFSKQINSDFLISLKIQVTGQTAIIEAFCLDMKTVKTMSRTGKSIPYGSFPMSLYEEMSKNLIDGLKHYEICPFTGPVNVTVSTRKDTTITEEYPVYCNGNNEQYKKVTKTNNNTESTWNLVRKAIAWADGDMKFSTSEDEKIVEENGCYKCPSGREGGRSYNEKKSLRVSGNGISQGSIRDNKPQRDTRIELEFLIDGTYLIKPRSASLSAMADEKIEVSAQGTCDNLQPTTKTINKKITVPLNPVFGPYPGISTDKMLKQKDTKKYFDPVTQTETTVTIDFELRHD